MEERGDEGTETAEVGSFPISYNSRMTVRNRGGRRGGRCNSAENSSFDRDICGHSTFIPYNERARVNESN